MLNSDVTLRRVIWELKQWADNHKMINKFMGFGEYLQTQLESERVYPIMVVNVTTSPSETWYINYQFEVMILDWVKDDQSNRSRVLSDTRQILNDLEETISFSNRWNDFSKLKGSFNCTDAIEKGRDKSFGWIASFTLGIKKRHGICNIKALLPEYNFESGEFIPPTCDPVTVEINGMGTTPTPSGSDKAVTLYDQFGDPLSGTIDSDTATSVNILIQTPRIYIRPAPTNQTQVYSDYDDYWCVLNGVDTYVPPKIGMPMLKHKTHWWLLADGVTNEFGNQYITTGENGGYFDPLTNAFYDVDGYEVSEAAALGVYRINHSNGIMYLDSAGTYASYELMLSEIFELDLGGYDDWFAPNITQLSCNLSFGSTGNYSRNGNEYPLYATPYNIGRGNPKLSSTTYVNAGASCWQVTGAAQVSLTEKASVLITTVPARFHYK